MRISIDYDVGFGKKRNLIGAVKVGYIILKGSIINRRFPSSLYRTRKGYHIIWSNLNIGNFEMYRRRAILGDDPNRIRLDRTSNKRLKQVLFQEKKVTYFNDDGSIKSTEEFKRKKIL